MSLKDRRNLSIAYTVQDLCCSWQRAAGIPNFRSGPLWAYCACEILQQLRWGKPAGDGSLAATVVANALLTDSDGIVSGGGIQGMRLR